MVNSNDAASDDSGAAAVEAQERLSDRFVRHYDDPAVWDYSIWLGLTEAGERAAKTMLSSGRSD